MQYSPPRGETPTTLLGVAQPGPEIPPRGWKCSTILLDGIFVGHIIERSTPGARGVTNVLLGWNVVPEFWGMGIMVRSLELLFERRFETRSNIDFVACCFASNHRCIRVIEKLGFQSDKLTISERFSHFIDSWGRERVLKYRLTYNLWGNRGVPRITQPSGEPEPSMPRGL